MISREDVVYHKHIDTVQSDQDIPYTIAFCNDSVSADFEFILHIRIDINTEGLGEPNWAQELLDDRLKHFRFVSL